MQSIFGLFLLLGTALAVSTDRSSRISNGETASALDYPSAVGILISGTSSHTFCGGVLISTRFILTTASCVSGTNTLTILAGASDMTRIVEIIPVLNIPSHIIIHPNYSSFFNRDDLAIVQLSRPVALGDYIGVARLPDGTTFRSPSRVGTRPSSAGETLEIGTTSPCRCSIFSTPMAM
ncbi:serine protease1/2 [Culex quinquefasciatus]|uniref:Serine protease1/2 n=1 Tax=Culex quinquefasciatus TaxID=7176 RepID=B0W3X1_CULQU|nr:serine protease1/2 [Culex quinquefasciatus]|eukprot:XP_001843405.1 serine protease1/2 [Culex quinquefasciatus]